MSEHKTWISEGLLIAFIPTAGYWIAFLYEFGFSKYFDIPVIFIEIGLMNAFIAAVSIFSLILIFIFIFDPIFLIINSLPKPLMRIISNYCLALMIVLGLSIVNKATIIGYLLVILFIVLLLMYELIAPIFWQRKTKGYIAKLKKHREKELHSTTIFDAVAAKIGRNWFSMLFYLYLISIIAYSAGGYNAKHKTDFIVITDPSELVVLKKYNSYLLAANFDRSSKVVTTNFHKIDIAKELKDFKYIRIGPLVSKGLSN